MERALDKGVVLPRFVVIKSDATNQYLSYTKEKGKFHCYLKFCVDNPLNPYEPCTKFEIHPAKTSPRFVNIKSCYSHQYWALINPPIKNNIWIGAAADTPNEDQSSRGCTLFEPFYDPYTKSLKLRHVNLDKYVHSWTHSSSEYYGFMYADEALSADASPCCKIQDWESFVILPKYVAFKGNDGKYLRATEIMGVNVLQFSGTDLGDPAVAHEVICFPEGDFELKTADGDKFWMVCFEGWLRLHSSNIYSGTFVARKVNDNTLALQSMGYRYIQLFSPGQGRFCQRLTRDGFSDCLNANSRGIIKDTFLKVEEPVAKRSIYGVTYDLTNSKVYDRTVVTMATGVATNRSEEKSTMTLKFSYTETTSSRWDASLSLKVGAEFSFKTGVPLIFEGGVRISTEFTGGYSWGKTNQTSNTVESDYQVIVEPMTMVKVNLIATRGRCDIPFSYLKSDTLFNGGIRREERNGGVFYGINCYEFRHDKVSTPLT